MIKISEDVLFSVLVIQNNGEAIMQICDAAITMPAIYFFLYNYGVISIIVSQKAKESKPISDFFGFLELLAFITVLMQFNRNETAAGREEADGGRKMWSLIAT